MRLTRVALLAVVALALTVAPASASVTLGAAPGGSRRHAIRDRLQPAHGQLWTRLRGARRTGRSLPGARTPSSARTGKFTLKVFRKVMDPAFFTAVAHDGPRDLTSGVVNPFTTSIAVRAGDLLGVYSPPANPANTWNSAGPGDTLLFRSPGLSDGQQANFMQFAGKINLQAVFEPSNSVTVGTTTRHKKKGTATLHLTLPNPGELTASGNGVKATLAGQAVTSKPVGAGQAQLLIKATGKKKRKLNETGKVKLNVGITYTPTGGDPSTQSVKVKLKKKL